ncbi:DUF2061 domain-containing protein [Haloplanus aerogenes]|uniref:DUF2061 domain-containing protein n=1 Tax=Haloplanus aerogenes TaxID=660522 RepID=A0A3M0DR08_9EURY|nr:DUF2061 domain-containing protein [Haloplanus aerogenes]AZH24349.1 DUF2061 domain-containing protein [Haloplanus aerogenes]RMB24017.1 putative membrane protein [Haloplanus aerogenes]
MVPSVTARPRQPRSRALVKTLGYRLLMVIVTVVVAWAVVGDLGEAASIGLVANLVKTGTYYAYERFWDRVAWGLEG